MYLYHIAQIIKCINDLIDGTSNLGELAKLLDMSPAKLLQLLNWNDVLYIDGTLKDGVTPQDILNVIMLYYSLKDYYRFFETGFTSQKRKRFA